MVRAAADNRSVPAVVAAGTAADIVLVAVVVVKVVAALLAVVVLASLAVFDSYHKTSLRRQPEHRTGDTDTSAASQPHACTE